MENGLILVLGRTALHLVGQMGSNNGIEPVQANMEEHLVQENRPNKEFVIVELAAQVFIRKQNYQCQDYSWNEIINSFIHFLFYNFAGEPQERQFSILQQHLSIMNETGNEKYEDQGNQNTFVSKHCIIVSKHYVIEIFENFFYVLLKIMRMPIQSTLLC